MKTIFLLGLLILGSSLSYAADIDKYAVQKKDGSVVILNYLTNSEKSLQQVLIDSGLNGLSIFAIEDSDIPQDRVDRKYWTIQNGKIVIDIVKKQNDRIEKEQAENANVIEEATKEVELNQKIREIAKEEIALSAKDVIL